MEKRPEFARGAGGPLGRRLGGGRKDAEAVCVEGLWARLGGGLAAGHVLQDLPPFCAPTELGTKSTWALVLLCK